ncbi:hypothetical protein Dimus_024699 [Dionaea muscipula]
MKDWQNSGSLGVVQAVAASPLVVVGSNMPTVGAPCSVQVSPLSMGDGGLVREEAQVSPMAREALRSQPTDGLRHAPSSPAEPADFKGPLEGEAVSWPMNPGHRKSSRHWLGGRHRRDHRTSGEHRRPLELDHAGEAPLRCPIPPQSRRRHGEKPSPDVRSAAKVSEALIGLSVGVDGDSEGVLTSRHWSNLVPFEVGLALGEVSMEACCDSSPPCTASMADKAGASLPGEFVVNGAGALASLAGGCEECSTVVPMAAGSGLRKKMGGQLA